MVDKSMMRRVSMTLPDDLVSKLDRVALLQGISRSSLVAGLLSQAVGVLDLALHAHADAERGDEDGLRRFRAGSIAIVNERIAELKELLNE